MIGTIIHAHFSDTLQGDKINLCHYTWNMISQLIDLAHSVLDSLCTSPFPALEGALVHFSGGWPFETKMSRHQLCSFLLRCH